MEFRFSDEDEAFRQEVRAFIRAELPKAREGESFTKKLAAKGWLTMSWPREYGGQGAPHLRQLVYNEEMAYHRAPGQTMGADRVGPTLILFGTEEQKARFLPAIARDEMTWCQGFSEPGSGSDLASLQTRAVRDGDSWVITGQKIWTSNAQRADFMILLARTDPDAPKHRGITYFLVDMTLPGITVRPLVQMTGQAGFNEVFFDDVRVPADMVVGEVNRGWYVSTATLDFERSGIGRVIGGLRTFEEVVAYAKAAPARDGGGGTLYDRPEVRLPLADIALGFQVGRLMSYRVAWMQSRGLVPNYEASMAKTFGTELHQRMARTAYAALGLRGQLMDGAWAPLGGQVPMAVLQTVSLTIAAGTSEINRNIIATRGLGLPRG
ncbi:acyl-CoA dehydrogenase family protein [Tepidiforma sp.]|uniref:acyl-CoA dehydrogenase family protein n=1 Tax=Tepidiforma sp. TaxID=2682230 RepID=UPI0021DBD482|nr:acyl-CoA dehydrogenase family protein [Tepidiforma sp.]MCX7616748.1 acyl-CoA dehydrogenase family protein [Tepidiforma sp.]GIW19525.1 MAG: acyl-CoA dehydrogenase [Tepidiforma sp.]